MLDGGHTLVEEKEDDQPRIGRERGMVRGHWTRVVPVLLAVALGIGGVGPAASVLWASAPTEDPPRRAAFLAAQSAPKPTAPNRVDLYGDPLPAGAVARLGTKRFNHGSLVNSVAFSPDGSVLASLGSDRVIRIWDPHTGREIRQLGNGLDPLNCKVFSPDGKTMAAGTLSNEGRVILFDVATGRELRRSDLVKESTFVIAFAPDGQTIVTGDASSGRVILWETRSLKELRGIEAHRRETSVVAFTPDGKTLVTGGNDMAPRNVPGEAESGSVAIFDVATGQELQRFRAKNAYVVALSISRDGRHLAMGASDDSICLFDLPAGKAIRTLFPSGKPLRGLMTDGGIKCLAFSPDGKVLASGAQGPLGDPSTYVPARTDGRDAITKSEGVVNEFEPYSMTLWDAATGQRLWRIPAHIQWVADLAFSPDGKALASCGAETVIRLWDVGSRRELHASDAPHSAIRSLAISPDGRSLTTGGYDGTILEWDLTTGRQRRLIGRCTSVVADLAFTPDGKGLVTGSFDETCRLWEVASGKELRRYDIVRGWISHVAIAPDGRSLSAGSKVVDLATGRLQTTLRDSRGNELAAFVPRLFTPDGEGVVVKTRDGVQLHDMSNGQLLAQLAQPAHSNYWIALSPDGRFLATGGGTGFDDQNREEDYPIQLWELASGQEAAQLGGHRGPTDGRRSQVPPRARPRRRVSYADALAFSQDGRWLVSGRTRRDQSDGGYPLRLWDLPSLVPRYRLQGHRNAITEIAFSPDGRWLASASEDATVLVWDIARLVERRGAVPPAPLDLNRLWVELDNDAARAYRAIWTLAAGPERVVPFLADRLKPIGRNDPEKDTTLGPLATGETLRRLRAIAVLEKIGTPEARRVLERLASGLDGARETRDAKATLRRLDRK